MIALAVNDGRVEVAPSCGAGLVATDLGHTIAVTAEPATVVPGVASNGPGATVTAGETTVLPFTIWMPTLDTRNAVKLLSPTTSEVVVTTPHIPGLELHIPAGTVIRDEAGQPVTEISITPVPADRPPFPLVPNVETAAGLMSTFLITLPEGDKLDPALEKALRPGARVYGVEPSGAPGMRQSLDRGAPVKLDRVETIADGLAAPFIGELTFAHAKALVDDVFVVDDAEIVAAMKTLMQRIKVLPEPAGAAALAPLLAGNVPLPAQSTVAVVVSGGNVDLERLRLLL